MKKWKYPNIYLALFVSLVAIAVGTVVSVKSAKTQTASSKDEPFSRITIEWSEPEELIETGRVNAPVTGIADERNSTEADTEKSERFFLPMGKDIIKDYSNGEMVRSNTMNDWRVHNGIDFGGSEGNTVVAVADGIVISCVDDAFWGGAVEIDHGNGMTVRYCGLTYESAVKEGSQVSAGEKIGTLGSIPIEAADGGHLHLEVTVNNKNVDPLSAMNFEYEEQ